jgi:DNA-binding NtrC family response regulator
MISHNVFAPAKPSEPAERKASVLIIEDDDALGLVLASMFESSSFVVSRTTDGASGLRSISLMDFDVILCDLVMPNLSGDLLYLAVGRVKPRLCSRFIFMSGYLDDPKWKHFAGLTDCTMLCKPFAMNDLANAVQEVMTKNRLKDPGSCVEFRGIDAEKINSTPLAGTSLPPFRAKNLSRSELKPLDLGWTLN